MTSAETVSREELNAIYSSLVQAQDCIRGETPEDVSDEDARIDTVEKLRDSMRTIEAALRSPSTLPTQGVGEIEAAGEAACKADMYALWCDECLGHPAQCPLRAKASALASPPTAQDVGDNS